MYIFDKCTYLRTIIPYFMFGNNILDSTCLLTFKPYIRLKDTFTKILDVKQKYILFKDILIKLKVITLNFITQIYLMNTMTLVTNEQFLTLFFSQ